LRMALRRTTKRSRSLFNESLRVDIVFHLAKREADRIRAGANAQGTSIAPT
jgi:hypothetical protein